MTNHKRSPTAAQIDIARAKAAGTYVYPKPVKATKASKFMTRYNNRPKEVALYSPSGAPIGPPRRSSQKRDR